MPAPTFSKSLVLRATGLALARGGRRLAAGVDFSLESGRALVVTGPNGAGKSTLLRVLAGLLASDAGAVALEGAGEDGEPGARAHYVAHAEAQKTALTAAENLEFWARTLGGGGLAPVDALARFNLAHCADLPVGYLSAGQRRRAALARLLVAPRPLWLLDEPATALDAASQAGLAAIMAAHLAAGGIIVAATHAPLGLEGAAALKLGAAP